MTTVANKLRRIDAARAKRPQLLGPDRETYDRIGSRLSRAHSDKRRAVKRGDAKKLAAAERAIARAKEARDVLLAPAVSRLWAPARIIATLEAHWHGTSGTTGIHHHICEMVLDHKDLSGPEYRTVCVLKNEGGPPANARSAPDTMGVAWFALADQIRCGRIVVVGDEEPS